MNVILLRRVSRLDRQPEGIPGPGEWTREPIPNDERGIRFEVGKMREYVRHFSGDPLVVRTARRIVQLCPAKDKTCEMQALWKWTKDHMRYVNDPEEKELIATPPLHIAEIMTPPEVIRRVLGDELIRQMSGFGIGHALLEADSRKTQIVCRGCFRTELSGLQPMTSGDCDEACLSPDRKLWIRVNGEIRRIEIRDLVRFFRPVLEKSYVLTGKIVDLPAREDFLSASRDLVEVWSIRGGNTVSAKPVWRRVRGMYRRRAVTKLLRIRVAGGREIVCTPNHRLYVNTTSRFRSIRAGDLHAGDVVVGVNDFPEHLSREDGLVSTEDAFMLGFWLADGCYDEQHGPKFSCGNDEELLQRVRAWALTKDARDGPAKCSASKSRKGDLLVHSRKLMSWMKELGFSGFSDTKRVPSFVFSLSDEKIALLLNGYFKGDGSIGRRSDGFHVVASSSVSPGLTEDVADLLERLSIYTTKSVGKGHSGYSPDHLPDHRLCVSRVKGIIRFMDRIGNFRNVDPSVRDNPKSVYATSYRSVKSIESFVGDEVFDLEVEPDKDEVGSPDSGNVYVVDGLLTHNSTFLATLLASVGIKPRFRFGGSEDGRAMDGCNYHHVWVQGLDETGNWIDMDITEPKKPFGWFFEGFGCKGITEIF